MCTYKVTLCDFTFGLAKSECLGSRIIGSLIWAGKITPAIRTFVTQNDFSKKKISLFITMGRNKTRKALSNFKKAIEPHKPLAELAITDNLKNLENVEEKIEYRCNELLK